MPPRHGLLSDEATRVLLVGAAHYASEDWPDLEPVRRSTEALADLLRSRCGLDERRLHVLHDPAGAQELSDAVWAAADGAAALLLIFIGHATATMGGTYLRDLQLGTNSLVAPTARQASRDEALPFSEACRVIESVGVRRVLTILDCCYSRSARHPLQQWPGEVSVGLLASADSDELALAENDDRYTRFTGVLIDILEKGIPGRGPSLTVADVAEALQARLHEPPRAYELPNRELWQTPFADNAAWDAGQHTSRFGSADTSAEPNPPWPDLFPYAKSQRRYFFGRDSALEELTAAVRAADGTCPLLLTGPSGIGKTSLLRAGLLPSAESGDLLPGSGAWPVVEVRPGTSPMKALHSALTRQTGGRNDWPKDVPRTADEALALIRSLTADPHEEAGTDVPGGAASPPRRVLLIVDPLEEVLQQGVAEPDRDAFFRTLLAASRPDGTYPAAAVVVAGVRDDFRNAVREAFGAAPAAEVALKPMTPKDLREVVEKSAQAAGVRVDPGLTSLVLRDTGATAGSLADPGVLPLLSHALAASWMHTEGGWLTALSYEKVRGIRGAISKTADDAFGVLSETERREARAILLSLVAVDRDRETYIRRRVPSELLVPDDPSGADARTALSALTRARLIVVDGGFSEISHESLFTAWPDLKRWIEGARGRLLERQEIDEAARYWENNHRLPGEYRLTGRSAERRTRWPADGDVRLDRRQRNFLKASLQAARRRRQVRVGALSVIFTLLVTSTVFFAVARQQSEHRAQAQRAALAQQLVTVADSLRADDPRTALLLAVSGARAGASRQADTVLQRIFQATAFDGVFTVRPVAGTKAPAVDSVSYGDDGHQLAVGTAAGGTVLIDPTRRPMQELDSIPYGHGGKVESVSYAPTAGLLAEGGSDGTVLLVSTTDPRHRVVATLDAGTTTVSSVAWSPDSRLVAAATRNRGTLLWDVSRPAHPVPLAALPSAVGVDAVAFAPAGNLVATAGDDARVTLWTLSRPGRPTPRRLSAGVTSPLDALAFSPDGTMVASGAKDGSAQLWTAGGRGRWRRVSLNGHTAAVLAVAFSPDSGMLASASADGSTALWHLDGEGAASQSSTLLDGPSAVTSVAFSPDGHTLATGSNDGDVVRWDLYRHQNAVALPVHVRSPRPAEAVTASAPGTTVAVTHDDGTVDLIGLGPPTAAASWRTLKISPGDPVTAAAFGPEDAVLATGAASGRVTVSDLDPRHPHAVSHWQAGAAPVRALAATPRTTGGTSLLAVADATSLTVWNIGDAAHPGLLSVLPAARSPISALAFSADGRQLAVGDDKGDTTVWNLASPEHPLSKGSFTLPGQAAVLSTATSADGRRLAVAASDGKTYLLTVGAATRPHLEATLPNATTAVGFVPGTHMLICLTRDGAPVVWDVSVPKDATPLFTVHGGTGDTRSLTVTSDGGTLVSVGAQGGIRAWRLSDLIPHTRLGLHACLLTGGSLTRAQWTRYAPGLPYDAVCS
ncbi:hypothetical protein OHB00_02520 [Streptomyces sp. NBC_00631]|uniref:nSTAND1 domain-containing NTPase n=1 Tax=Streptomyces sp. NBC_00631 TaxID=2975793 RepID=UPI0030DEF28A